ncbi:MAG: ATP-binding protein [bacterium]
MVLIFSIVGLVCAVSGFVLSLYLILVSEKKSHYGLLLVIFLLLLFVTVSNALEWSGLYAGLDRLEDFTDILLPLIMGILIYDLLKTKVEEETERSKNQFEKIFNNTFMGIAVFNRDSDYISANRKYLEILDYRNDEIVRLKYPDTIHPGDKQRCVRWFKSLITGQTDQHTERKILMTRNGREAIVETYLTPIKDEEGNTVKIIEIINPISRKRDMENFIRNSERMKSVSNLAGGIAHDFNDKLTSIILSAETLEEQIENEHIKKDLNNILNAAIGISDMTGKLLAFARKGSHRREMHDVHAVINDVIKMLEKNTPDSVNILTDFRAEDSVFLCNYGEIENVFAGLGINAVSAVENGGKVEFISENRIVKKIITVAYPPDRIKPGRYITITVRDNGRGMNKQTMKRILEPFYSLDSKTPSTGMGLPAAYGIVKSHNGFVDINSYPEKGSSFTVYLPIK